MRRTRRGRDGRVRVLLVAPSLDVLGGMSVHAADLVENLRREPSAEVTFVATNPRLPGALRSLQSIRYVRTVVTSGLFVARLLRRVRRHDVVHVSSAAHTSFVISSTPPILIAALFRKPAILNYHSGDVDVHLGRWRRSATWTMRRCRAIAVPSRHQVNELARHGLTAQLVPNTIERDRFPYRERRPPRPVFLSNRQLLPVYNVACVLRAFALVRQRFPAARLIVAGDGSQRPQLERLAARLRLHGVQFVGWVDPARMPDLYDAADVYLNASSYDAAPLSVLEAFASGLPVVSTPAGGIPEVVRPGETGMLVGSDDHAAMAACAMRLLEEPGLAAGLAARAREECARFAWPTVREEWLALYDGVTSRTGTASPR